MKVNSFSRYWHGECRDNPYHVATSSLDSGAQHIPSLADASTATCHNTDSCHGQVLTKNMIRLGVQERLASAKTAATMFGKGKYLLGY